MTTAGTFKNIIKVKSSDGYISYFAPNVGFIKGTAIGFIFGQRKSTHLSGGH
jgi:hypothetical protein